MKTVKQIADECNIDKDYIYRVAKKIGIFSTDKTTRYRRYDKYQEDLIHQVLYFEGKITEITLESKINL